MHPSPNNWRSTAVLLEMCESTKRKKLTFLRVEFVGGFVGFREEKSDIHYVIIILR